MGSRFEFILAAEDIRHGKPHPEIYQKAAERFGLKAREMLVLEDSQNGCLSAARAGAFVVAVPSDLSRDQDFRVASLVVNGLADPRLYEALGLSDARS
jgi:beta-phosphoglucomutase-like phosphatase (HAD superfamily)